MKNKKRCLECNVLFEPRRIDQKYCCKKHASRVHGRYWRTKHKVILEDKQCLECGDWFTPNNRRQKYCCTAHQKRNYARYLYYKNKVPLEDKRCPECGDWFTPNNKRQIYCCRKHAMRVYFKRWHNKNRHKLIGKYNEYHKKRRMISKSKGLCIKCHKNLVIGDNMQCDECYEKMIINKI